MKKTSLRTAKGIFTSLTFKQVGAGLILLACAVLVLIYWPVIATEFNYRWWQQTQPPSQQLNLTASKTDDWPSPFAIAINKINLVAPIVAQVSPFNSNDYQEALETGVAHAIDTGLPDDEATMVLFAHSSGTIFDSHQATSQFLLLNKLSRDDQVAIFYQGQTYYYLVVDKQVVPKEAVQYLDPQQSADLVLITCYPIGTRLKRLVVMAQRVADNHP